MRRSAPHVIERKRSKNQSLRWRIDGVRVNGKWKRIFFKTKTDAELVTVKVSLTVRPCPIQSQEPELPSRSSIFSIFLVHFFSLNLGITRVPRYYGPFRLPAAHPFRLFFPGSG